MATEASKIPFIEAAAPATPAATRVVVYAKADGLMYSKDDAGAETLMSGGVGGSVATDAIWDAAGDLAVGTGANTAAKLVKGNAGGYLAMGNSAVIWNAATSFPASKATNDRYFRTDLGEEYLWDGTRWASSDVKVIPFPLASAPPLTGTGVLHRMAMPPGGNSDIYLAGVYGSLHVVAGTALSASHKWVGTVSKSNTAGSASLGTITIDSGALNQWRAITALTINAVAAVASGYVDLEVSWAKTGTPGNLYCNLMLVYRTVST